MEKRTAFNLKNKFLKEVEFNAQQRYVDAINCMDAKKALYANLELEFINDEKKFNEQIVLYDLDPAFKGVYSSEEIDFALQEFKSDFLARMNSYAVRRFSLLLAPELSPKEAMLWIDAMSNKVESRTASLVELIRLQEGK